MAGCSQFVLTMKKLCLEGKVFSRLSVLSYAGSDGRNSLFYCRCKCGKHLTASGYRIKNGHVKSCGCLQRETASNNAHKQGTHYASKSPEYRAWRAMKRRCYYKKYQNYHLYGGRGIRVCKRWLHSFSNFLADVGPRPSAKHSLDRKNSNKNYTPKNVRWATVEEQNKNRRKYGTIEKFTTKELLNELHKRKTATS